MRLRYFRYFVDSLKESEEKTEWVIYYKVIDQ